MAGPEGAPFTFFGPDGDPGYAYVKVWDGAQLVSQRREVRYPGARFGVTFSQERSGSELIVRLQVRDRAGHPVAADLAVSVQRDDAAVRTPWLDRLAMEAIGSYGACRGHTLPSDVLERHVALRDCSRSDADYASLYREHTFVDGLTVAVPWQPGPDSALVFWKPRVVTDARGRATIRLPLPAAGRYRIVAEGWMRMLDRFGGSADVIDVRGEP